MWWDGKWRRSNWVVIDDQLVGIFPNFLTCNFTESSLLLSLQRGENDRGVSYTFGPDIVAKFLHKHDLDLICRAHQVSGRAFPFSLNFEMLKLLFLENSPSNYNLIIIQLINLPINSRTTAGRRGWLRVLRQTPAGHFVLGAELLRRIRQCWSDDERRRVVNVFLPGAFRSKSYGLPLFDFLLNRSTN